MNWSREKYERTDVDEEGLEEVSEDRAAERENVIFKITSLVWLIAGIIVAIIGFRVLLKLLAANPDSGFVDFIYNISYPFVAPFFGILGTPAVNGSVFEFSSVIAMIVYLLVAWGIVALINIIFMPTRARRTRVLNRR
ncbi:MAG: YggT family protein [Thermoleophilia bacterium]|nr:YggT family protein [Thermoleophilia bacterium]